MIRTYLDTIWTTLTQPIVSGLMHLPIIPISINYQDRFLACQYLSAPVFFKIFLTSLHHNETLKAKKKGIFKNDLLFCKNEWISCSWNPATNSETTFFFHLVKLQVPNPSWGNYDETFVLKPSLTKWKESWKKNQDSSFGIGCRIPFVTDEVES